MPALMTDFAKGSSAVREADVNLLQKQYDPQNVANDARIKAAKAQHDEQQLTTQKQQQKLNELAIDSGITGATDSAEMRGELSKLYQTPEFLKLDKSQQMTKIAEIYMKKDPIKGAELLSKAETTASKETKDREEKLKEAGAAMEKATAALRAVPPEKFQEELNRIKEADPKQYESIKKVIGNLDGENAHKALDNYIMSGRDQLKAEMAKYNADSKERIAAANREAQLRRTELTILGRLGQSGGKTDAKVFNSAQRLDQTFKKEEDDIRKEITAAEKKTKEKKASLFGWGVEDAQKEEAAARSKLGELMGKKAEKLRTWAEGVDSDKLSGQLIRMAEAYEKGTTPQPAPEEKPAPTREASGKMTPDAKDFEAKYKALKPGETIVGPDGETYRKKGK